MVVEQLIHQIGFELNREQVANVRRFIANLQRELRNLALTMGGLFTLPLKMLGKSMIQIIASIESLEVAFGTMLGGADKAKTLIEELFELVKKTPFEIETAFKGAKRLLSFGFKREDLIEELTMVGDLAAGLSIPLNQLVKAYGDVKVKGKLAGQEVLQLQNAGVGITQELAKYLNVAGSKIPKMISNSQISFKMVREVLKNMTSEGGKFFNMMQAQSKTLGGMWSNFKDNLTLSALKFRSTWEPLLKNIINMGIKITDAVSKGLTPAMARVLTIFGTLMSLVGPTILAVIYAKVGLIIGAITAVTAVISSIIEDIVVWTQGGQSLLGLIIGDKDDLFKAFGFVGDSINKIKELVGELFTEIKYLFIGMIDGNEYLVSDQMDLIFKKISAIIDEVLLLIMKIMESPVFQNFITKIGEMLGKMAIGFFNFIMTTLGTVLPKIHLKIGSIFGGGISSIFKGMTSWTKDIDRLKEAGVKGTNILSMLGIDRLFGSSEGSAEKLGSAIGGKGPTFDIKANIVNQVPEGTTAGQADAIKNNSEKFFGDVMSKIAQSLQNNIPVIEK